MDGGVIQGGMPSHSCEKLYSAYALETAPDGRFQAVRQIERCGAARDADNQTRALGKKMGD